MMSMENSMEEAQEFIDQVIQRFNKETDIFRDLFSNFRILRYKLYFSDDLCKQVQVLFKGHADLIQGIHKFFPTYHRCGVLGGDGSGTPPSPPPPTPSTSLIPSPSESNRGACGKRIKKQKSKINRDLEKKECVDFMNRVFRNLDDVEKFEEFLKQIMDYQKHKNVDLLDEKFLVMFKVMPELHNEFTRFMISREEEESQLQTQKRNLNKTFYTRIIDNPDEEKLFICEDNMYEADMAFHLLKSTKKAVERYLKYKKVIEAGGTDREAVEEHAHEEMLKFKRGIEADTEAEKVEEEEFFGALHKKQIKKLYYNLSYGEDLGEEILDQLLNKQPIIAGERILQRLEEKFEECKIWREKQEKICKEGFESNYEKFVNYKPPSLTGKKRKRV